ncbi:MAG: hypothetical protein M3R44_06265, partial [Candidatus Eremiobacteraeota bacterium]|nr:hypothetical protein [Candidatus Eremiobacteraeota bacterium]
TGSTPAGPSSPLLFADDFRADTVGAPAAGWTAASGSWQVCRADGFSQYCEDRAGGGVTVPNVAGQASWGDYSVDTVPTEIAAPGAVEGVAIIGRLVDSQHFYQLELRPDVAGSGRPFWYIWKYSPGRWTEIAGGPFSPSTPSPYRLRLTFSGTSISASLASSGSGAFLPLGSGSDGAYRSGGIALRCWGNGTARFGPVRVVAILPGSPGPTPPPSPEPAPSSTPGLPGGIGYDGQPVGTTFFAHNALARPLSANPRIDPQSAAMVAAVTVGDLSDLQFTASGRAGTVVSTGKASDPSYTVHCLEPWGHCNASSVHVPNGTTAGEATDFHNAFIDSANGTDTDSWLTCAAYQSGGRSGAGYYGSPCSFPLATSTLDIGWGGSGPLSGDGTGFSGTASGLSLVAGIVRPEDLLAGTMTHGVSIAVQCVQRGANVYPATGSDGLGNSSCTGAAAVPRYGQILWLDGTGEAQLLAINPVVLQPYIRAMHDYGFYITDRDEGSSVPAGTDEFASNVEANPAWLTVVDSIRHDAQAVDTTVAAGSFHIYPRVNGNIASHLHILDVSCSTAGC